MLAQKVTNQPLQVGSPASGVCAIVNDAGVCALVLGNEYSALAFTNLQPTHQREVSIPGSRGRGALVELGQGQLSAVFFGMGLNGRRPDITRIDFQRDGGQTSEMVASQPAFFAIEDLAAMECAGGAVVAFTDDTTGAGPCSGDYCARPLIHLTTGLDGGDWRSSETDGGYVRSVTLLRNGNSLDVAWLSASSDGTAQVAVAPGIVSCCSP